MNQSFGARHKATSKSVDDVILIARARLEAVTDDGAFWLEDSSGFIWEGSLHKEWTVVEWRSLVGTNS